MPITANQDAIDMMELRSQPGTVVDNVFYRNASFIIKRAGKARAVIVPLREYEEMQRRKQAARERFFAMTDAIRERTKAYDPEEIEAAIDEAVEAVRREKKST